MAHIIAQHFGKAAKTYDQFAHLQRQVARQTYMHFNSCMPMSGPLVDLGCGTGYLHELLRSHQHTHPLIQLDLAYPMCQIAHSYRSTGSYGSTYTLNANMQCLPLDNQSCHGVLSSLAMQWGNSFPEIVAEIQRILCPKSPFVFSLVGEGSLHQLRQSYEALGVEPPIHQFLSKEQIQQSFNSINASYDIQAESITEHYENIFTLLHQFRYIGANYHPTNTTYKGKEFYQKLHTYYAEHFGNTNGLPLTWHIIYVKGITHG